VYPVLAALASYNRSLEQGLQQLLIKCFEYGLLTSKCNEVCIVALTACILEISGSMYALHPEVLLNLSKISATIHIAIPVLSSSPPSSPSRRSSPASVPNNSSVFAITLPYTKFNYYTVSLAHHVIIMWFLKCLLVNRKDSLIIKGLGSNVLQPFEEGIFRKTERASLASLNQDSSNRKRHRIGGGGTTLVCLAGDKHAQSDL
jgi:tuberous sclerosis protein 2